MNRLMELINKVRNRANLTLEQYEEIIEYEITKFIENSKTFSVETLTLDTDLSLMKSKSLANDIIYLLFVKFNIKVELEDLDYVQEFLGKLIIELIINDINVINKKDIVETLVLSIIENLWVLDMDADKIDKIYLSKELRQFLLSKYSEIEVIVEELKIENPILKTLDHTTYLIVPIKWLKIEASKLLTKINTTSSNYLVVYLIGGKK